jgi:hypothetical protein
MLLGQSYHNLPGGGSCGFPLPVLPGKRIPQMAEEKSLPASYTESGLKVVLLQAGRYTQKGGMQCQMVR